MSVNDAHKALDDVLREERKVLTKAQEMVNAINAKREQAMQDLRQAIANDSPNHKPTQAGQKGGELMSAMQDLEEYAVCVNDS